MTEYSKLLKDYNVKVNYSPLSHTELECWISISQAAMNHYGYNDPGFQYWAGVWVELNTEKGIYIYLAGVEAVSRLANLAGFDKFAHYQVEH